MDDGPRFSGSRIEINPVIDSRDSKRAVEAQPDSGRMTQPEIEVAEIVIDVAAVVKDCAAKPFVNRETQFLVDHDHCFAANRVAVKILRPDHIFLESADR